MTSFKILKIKRNTILTYLIVSTLATSLFFFLKKPVLYNKYIYVLTQFQLDGNLYTCSNNLNNEFVLIENFLEKSKRDDKFQILRYKIFFSRELFFEIETTSSKNFSPIEFDKNLINYLNSIESKIFTESFNKKIKVSTKKESTKIDESESLVKEKNLEIEMIRKEKICKKKIRLIDSYRTSEESHLFFFSMNVSIFFFLILNNRLIQYVRRKFKFSI